jgi:hypothetical protein
VLLSSSHQQLGISRFKLLWLDLSPHRCREGCCLLRVLAIFWLDATARTYETINFDRFFQAKNLILAVYKVLMTEGTWC